MTDASRNVFVVHGRNVEARDAAFAFLEALDLRPLTWERAAKLTGKAQPTTLESVEAGLANAQAALVLMTGDDLARLRPELGRDSATSQPRPNVLIEAGMALSLLGRERTVLVRSGSKREVTDFSGLNFVDIDNSTEKRQALAGRLKQAGCPVDTGGSRHLDRATGGDFEWTFAPVDAPPFHARGVFDEHIVDSTISYRCNNIQLLKLLEQQLKTPGRSDLKFNYLGVAGAANWLSLAENAEYSASETKLLLDRALPRFIAREEITDNAIDFVSLGTGDGGLDAKMIVQFANATTVTNYYPLDISLELLQRTIERTSRVCSDNGISIKAILGDFLELPLFKPIFGYDDCVNVVSLVGFTFGNYNEGSLLQVLHRALNPGDLVILDARLHDLAEVTRRTLKDRRDELLPRFRHGANNRFAFGPVEMATSADYSRANIEQELSTRYTVVNEAFNVITYCTDLDARLRSGGRIVHRRLDLAATTFYNETELVDFIEEKEFQVVDRQKHEGAIALLLRRE